MGNMRFAGAHLSAFGAFGQVLYKGLQHGEGGGLYLHMDEDFCTVASSRARVLASEQLSRDDPRAIFRSWEKISEPLRQDAPAKSSLERCSVPQLLLERPTRYPA